MYKKVSGESQSYLNRALKNNSLNGDYCIKKQKQHKYLQQRLIYCVNEQETKTLFE